MSQSQSKPSRKIISDKILEHMQSGPLDVFTAATLYNTARLPTVASRLRKQGHPVERISLGGVTAYQIRFEGYL